ncbi:hypothetical protein [Sphingobacterium anhuiense]|uniref:hypothetical protein n=1 Tax=Sphingobacterium anhuiense TaxID=493780 RepID=UPI003C2EF181
MTLLEYNDLIKLFAAQDPDLMHTEEQEAVHCCSADEAAALLRGISDRMVLLLPPYAKNPRDNSAMGNMWFKQGLVIAVEFVPVGDKVRKLQVLNKAEQVLDRLYKFLNHSRRGDPLIPGVAPFAFDPKTWESDGIGPISENHFGYFAEFVLRDGIQL